MTAEIVQPDAGIGAGGLRADIWRSCHVCRVLVSFQVLQVAKPFSASRDVASERWLVDFHMSSAQWANISTFVGATASARCASTYLRSHAREKDFVHDG